MGWGPTRQVKGLQGSTPRSLGNLEGSLMGGGTQVHKVHASRGRKLGEFTTHKLLQELPWLGDQDAKLPTGQAGSLSS